MNDLFQANTKLLIGVIHLRPLPGSPRWDGNWRRVVEGAMADARAYERGGANAVIIENFGDVPFGKTVGPETVAGMAVAARAVREMIRLPMGFNVLRNDPHAALALCAACDGDFIRVNVHCGAMLTDQGLIEGCAADTVRLRKTLCPDARILADVHVKHAVPLGAGSIEDAAHDTLERGLADALIISGAGTGMLTNLSDVKRVRAVCPRARLLIGSGITAQNAGQFLPLIDGVIAGSSLKRGGKLDNPVEARRVAALARAIKSSP